jgi:hypothetical protein
MKMKFLYFYVLAVMTIALPDLGAALSNTTSPRIGPSTTIAFQEGTASLTTDSKAKLDSLINTARETGKVDEVHLAAWSDNPIPVDKKELSEADQSLAENRIKAVKEYLRSPLKVSDISAHNMAKRSTWLSRTFGTKDAELKEEITKGTDAPMSKEQFQVFKDQGKPSTAVLQVILKI